MRFGRAGRVPDEDIRNNPLVNFGNEDDFQIIGHQDPNPFQTIASLNDRENIEADLPEFVPAIRIGRRSRDPFLRIGRAIPYLRFGKKNFPYPRFGRNSPSMTNQAVEPFTSFEKSRATLHQADDAVTILTGSPGLGEENYGADRKKRSVDPQVQQSLAAMTGCVSGTETAEETDSTNLDPVERRDSRSKPYMRFGKKSEQQNDDNNKYTWDKDMELYLKNQADKRKQEYMRFGRAKEESTL